MTEARLAREGVEVALSNDTEDVQILMAREGVTVAHHFPESETFGQLARLGVVVAISRPHGWGIHDDPPL
jgi:hypothetical protein